MNLPVPPYGSELEHNVYQLQVQTYSANSTPHCTNASPEEIILVRTRTISCPAPYLMGTTAPYCFDSDYDYIDGIPLFHSHSCGCGRIPGSSTLVGEPIDVTSGDEFEEHVDYAGPDLRFVRYYHSATLNSHGQLGVGWADNFSAHLIISGSRPYGLELSDGYDDPVTLIGSEFVSQSGDEIHVQQTGSNWTAYLADGSRDVFDANGNLIEEIDPSGRALTLSYTNGLLTTVSDPYGHVLSFAYKNGQLIQLTDPAGGTIAYGYDSNGNLVSVTYEDGTTRGYVYGDASFPNDLTGIIDADGNRYATMSYDSTGRAVSAQRAGGANAVSVTYGSSTATVTNGIGGVKTFTFTNYSSYPQIPVSISDNGNTRTYAVPSPGTDMQQRVTQTTDPNGNVTTFAYDTDHLLSETEAYGTSLARTTTYQYLSPLSSLPTLISAPNRQTAFSYDSGTNLVQSKTVTDTGSGTSRTWAYTYDSHGRRLTATDPRGNTTTYRYYTCTTGYQCGELETVTNALGQVTTFDTYDADGRPLTITNPNGTVTTLAYDARGRLTSRTVGSETTSFSYYPTGLLDQVTLPDGSSLAYTYDAAHRLIRISDGLGNKIEYTLDAMGNRISTKTYDPTGTLDRTHTRVINALNEVAEDINAAGTSAVTTTYGYDSNGNRTSVDAPLSRNTAETYDALNRVKSITDPASGVSTFGYDAENDLTSVTDPRGLTTSYGYDGFGDLVSQTSPDAGTSTYTYDANGNLATATDARGAVATYSYDALNRVTSIAYSLGGTTDQTLAFTYDQGTDGIGHLTGASDSMFSTSWSYDALGERTGMSQTVGGVTRSVAYGYTNGDLTSLTTPSGQSVTYGYNTAHEVTSVAVNGTTILSNVSYEPFGPVDGWTWGNGSAFSRTFNGDGLITGISAPGSTESLSYDDADRISGITNTAAGASSWAYGYDGLDRLTSATSSSVTDGWTYDADGNRLSQTGTSASTYSIASGSNQITGITGALSRSYSYDAAGNTLSDSADTATYDAAGRLKTLTSSAGTTTFVYNALGQMIEASGPSGTTLYVYDQAGHLLGEYDGSGNLIQETVWLGNIPVATLRPSGSSIAVDYVETDQLDTPRAVIQPSNNALLWTWYSGPFGSAAPNENPSGIGTFSYDLRFPGQIAGAWGGTFQNYRRDYDSAVGRYVESDPIGLQGGINTYTYALNDPLLHIDPLGLYWEYCINTGAITYVNDKTGQRTHIGFGYSGIGPGYDNPRAQAWKNVGPIPTGLWRMGRAYNGSINGHHTGPLTIPLTPMPGTNRHGRYYLRIHGDKKHGPPHTASHGCIVASHSIREQMNDSSDRELKVVTCTG